MRALADLRALFACLGRGERRRWLGVLPGALAAAIVEALVAVYVLALLRALVEPDRAAAPAVLSDLAAPGARDWAVLLAVVAVLFLAKNALSAALARMRSRIASETEAALSTRLLHVYLSEPFARHQRRDSAEIMRDVLDTSGAACATLASALAFATNIAIAGAVLGVVLANAPPTGLVAVLSLAALAALLVAALERHASRWGAGARGLGAELLASLRDVLGVFKEMRLRGGEEHFVARFAGLREALARIQSQHAFWSSLPRPIIETLFVASAAVVVGVAAAGGAGTEGTALTGLYLYAGLRVLPIFQALVVQLVDIRYGLARVAPVLPALGVARGPLSEPASSASDAPLRGHGPIALADVGFTYEGGRAPALAGVSLTIAEGERLGVAGATGAGKSTLADMISGLLSPTRGSIRIGGVALADAADDWRRSVGYASAGTYLLAESLRRNIAFGVPEEMIDARRIDELLSLACLEGVVARLDEGVDAKLGEGGMALSAGERQRVGLARALYHRPALLVLDEAFASLDQETESRIAAAVARWLPGVTQLIVAHRPATLARCQRVVLLHEGRIEDCGSFEELSARSERFRRLMSAAG